MEEDLQKTRFFEGQFTTLHKEDITDIFYDIANVLMKGFAFEVQGKQNHLDFMISERNRAIVVTTNLRAVFSAKMINCEKTSCETLYDKEKILRDFDIDIDEWMAVLASDKKLQEMKEPMKRVFRYKMVITIPEEASDECKEFFEIGLELLRNIQ